MCSFAMPNSSLVVPADIPSLLRRRRNLLFFTSSGSFVLNSRSKIPRILHLSASLTQSNRLDLSWFPPEPKSIDNKYGGWAIVDTPLQYQKKSRGIRTIVIGGIGSSLAVLLATVAYFLISRKGFRFQFSSPIHTLHGVLSWTETRDTKREREEPILADEKRMVSEAGLEHQPDATNGTVTSAPVEKVERVIVSIGVDPTQQEALLVLKKLKIVEDGVRADELCTRREYARWLVHTNSLLERNMTQRINPSVSLSGSLVVAFDDVGVEDPDFESIQALAEAGIICSKLPGNTFNSSSSNGPRSINFFPERFISRKDLINWKAQLEYELKPGIIEEISRTKVDYMDVKEISSDASPELFMDMAAGEKSIIRRVFGQSKRLQPNKPSTKAQAAVALTSGRMVEAVSTELLRQEAENLSRQAEMDQVRFQLLDKGDIRKFWDEKLYEERQRGSEVENLYHEMLRDLEEEKTIQEKQFAEHLKEKAAMDCQRQLLFSLKEEVDQMSERLASESATYVAEKGKLQYMLSDLLSRQEELLDKKSILEAEKEAIRILRSWVEDEARKSQARAKVLEEVGRRWKWDDQA